MPKMNVTSGPKKCEPECACPIFKRSTTLWWRNADLAMSFCLTVGLNCALQDLGQPWHASSDELSCAMMVTIRHGRWIMENLIMLVRDQPAGLPRKIRECQRYELSVHATIFNLFKL